MNKELKSKARFLTLVLRHKPEEANITLDYNGVWLTDFVPPKYLEIQDV